MNRDPDADLPARSITARPCARCGTPTRRIVKGSVRECVICHINDREAAGFAETFVPAQNRMPDLDELAEIEAPAEQSASLPPE